ncbi:helix-turn-helix domain-containing protein [Micromonospora maritima]|uniref:Helix-turn-helix domain-containing protein n=1 Tax=Micromonospora maritima TaxID=986711 RepID=A0ABW7ZGV5_9ACTN
MQTVSQIQRPVGELLRGWREQRRLSQFRLASLADISTRHLSFIETGRSKPSRDMVLHLADHLELPLRERNHLLLAAGFAPVYGATRMDAPEMSPVRAALRRLLSSHEPFPALVIDRDWNLVDSNESLEVFTSLADPALLTPPVNVLRLALHPDGMARHIVNLGEWRAHLLGRLRRRVALTADVTLGELYEEISAYPCDAPEPTAADLRASGDIVVPLWLRRDGHDLRFFCTVATFGTPTDITLSELAIESFYPADERTGQLLMHARAAGIKPWWTAEIDPPATPATTIGATPRLQANGVEAVGA